MKSLAMPKKHLSGCYTIISEVDCGAGGGGQGFWGMMETTGVVVILIGGRESVGAGRLSKDIFP